MRREVPRVPVRIGFRPGAGRAFTLVALALMEGAVGCAPARPSPDHGTAAGSSSTAAVSTTGTVPGISGTTASGSTSTGTSSQATPPSATVATTTPGRTASRTDPRRWVQYERSGGFAGLEDQVVVSADGWATVTRHGRAAPKRKLTAAQLRQLSAALTAMDIHAIQGTYVDMAVRDGLTYRIRFDGAAVICTDGAIPKGVIPVLRALDPLLR